MDAPARPVLRFGLRTMLLAVALLCAVLAMFSALGWQLSALVLLFGSLIGLHVAGNAIGTRLRDTPRKLESPLPSATSDLLPSSRSERLSEVTGLQAPWLAAAAIGACSAGLLGGAMIALFVGPRLTSAGLIVGSGSSAIIGGWLGFLASSFWTISRKALQEAVEVSESHSPHS